MHQAKLKGLRIPIKHRVSTENSKAFHARKLEAVKINIEVIVNEYVSRVQLYLSQQHSLIDPSVTDTFFEATSCGTLSDHTRSQTALTCSL